MLDFPRVVDADAVGILDLLERVPDQPVLRVGVPRSGQLVLVEDAELHDTGTPPSAWKPSSSSDRRGLPASACSISVVAVRTKCSRLTPSGCSSAAPQSVPTTSVPGTRRPD